MPPPSPSLAQPMDLVLHIGSGKTGTSSLQQLLHQNREVLAARGLLFPSSRGRRRHVQFGLFIKPDDELVAAREYQAQGHRSPQEFRRKVRRRLFAEINEAAPSRVLISDEALYGSHQTAIERLRAFTDRHAERLQLVCYLRRQDDHLVSRYQQVVKVGEVRTLAERTAAALDDPKTYDYAARLDTWARIMEPDAFVVRRFERDAFVGGSLYADFLDAAGIDLAVGDLEDVPAQNESLDAESVEFLRLLNVHRLTTEDAQLGKNRPLVVRLAEASSGPSLTLPEAELDVFMARWEDSNREVARRWFDGDDELFRSPRKARGTTADQRLDPDRLDYFFTLTELSEELHAPLRRLVEDAAAARR